jgi:hypothetical protein
MGEADMLRLTGRIRRLESRRRPLVSEEDCPAPMIGAQISLGEELPDPADVMPCPNCSGCHVQVIEEVIVEPGDQVRDGALG